MPTASAPIPVEMECQLTSEVSGRLSELRNAILSQLARDEGQTERAATALLDSLETKVRIGWLIAWGKAFLINRGNWTKWMEQNFEIALPTLGLYERFSHHFSVDMQGIQQRKQLGIAPKGLAAVAAPALRTQIATAGFRSFREAMRVTGLLPPTSAEQRALRNGKAAVENKDTADEQLKYILQGLQFLEQRLRRIDPGNLSQEDRELLFEALTSITQQLGQLQAGASELNLQPCKSEAKH